MSRSLLVAIIALLLFVCTDSLCTAERPGDLRISVVNQFGVGVMNCSVNLVFEQGRFSEVTDQWGIATIQASQAPEALELKYPATLVGHHPVYGTFSQTIEDNSSETQITLKGKCSIDVELIGEEATSPLHAVVLPLERSVDLIRTQNGLALNAPNAIEYIGKNHTLTNLAGCSSILFLYSEDELLQGSTVICPSQTNTLSYRVKLERLHPVKIKADNNYPQGHPWQLQVYRSNPFVAVSCFHANYSGYETTLFLPEDDYFFCLASCSFSTRQAVTPNGENSVLLTKQHPACITAVKLIDAVTKQPIISNNPSEGIVYDSNGCFATIASRIEHKEAYGGKHVSLVLLAPGYCPKSIPLPAEGTTELPSHLEVELQPAPVLRGRVENAADISHLQIISPLPQLERGLLADHLSPTNPHATVKLNADGSFSANIPPANSYMINVYTKQGLRYSLRKIPLSHEEENIITLPVLKENIINFTKESSVIHSQELVVHSRKLTVQVCAVTNTPLNTDYDRGSWKPLFIPASGKYSLLAPGETKVYVSSGKVSNVLSECCMIEGSIEVKPWLYKSTVLHWKPKGRIPYIMGIFKQRLGTGCFDRSVNATFDRYGRVTKLWSPISDNFEIEGRVYLRSASSFTACFYADRNVNGEIYSKKALVITKPFIDVSISKVNGGSRFSRVADRPAYQGTFLDATSYMMELDGYRCRFGVRENQILALPLDFNYEELMD